jgi:hypothetical protein
MSKVEEIRERFIRGYTMTLYGTREILHKQMEDDIQFLLNLFSAENNKIERKVDMLGFMRRINKLGK